MESMCLLPVILEATVRWVLILCLGAAEVLQETSTQRACVSLGLLLQQEATPCLELVLLRVQDLSYRQCAGRGPLQYWVTTQYLLSVQPRHLETS